MTQTSDHARLLDPGNTADVQAFRSLRLEALERHPEAYASRLEDWIDLADTEWARRMQSAPTFALFSPDNAPLGLMGYYRESSSRMAHRAQLIMVYLRPGNRGSGGAAALLGVTIAHARAAGLLQMELTVASDNTRAIAFYERAGFRHHGCIPRGVRFGDRFVDDRLMHLPL